MSFEPVAERRSHAEEGPAGFSVVIPARKRWFAILFLVFWLGGWAVGEIAALRQIVSGGEVSGANLFLLFWVCGWTLGGLWAAYNVLWMLAGSERITIASGALVIRKQACGIGRERAFDLSEASGLRVNRDGVKASMGSGGLTVPGIGAFGVIAFDYGVKTVRFAEGIDEAEAAMIVNELSSRHSFEHASSTLD